MALYDLSCRKCKAAWTLVVPQNYGSTPRNHFICPSCRSRAIILEGYDRFGTSSVHELNIQINDVSRRLKTIEDAVFGEPDPATRGDGN